MLAFMDAEFNSFPGPKTQREDMDLIEFALIITTDDMSKSIQTYRTFVYPETNNGKIYGRIKRLTGITNQDVRNGKLFPEVIADVNKIVQRYGIKKIYAFDQFDKIAMKWNQSNYPGTPYSAFVIKKIHDISPYIRTKIGLNTNISVHRLAEMCHCEEESHKALNDARMLWKIVKAIKNDEYDKDIANQYLLKERKQAYINRLVSMEAAAKNDGFDFDELFQEFLERRKRREIANAEKSGKE